jgi:hypothetical protein
MGSIMLSYEGQCVRCKKKSQNIVLTPGIYRCVGCDLRDDLDVNIDATGVDGDG